MARTSRLLVLVVAWAVPVCWTVLALLAGPSDGTSLSSRLLPTAGARWDDTVRVRATYGETALRPGDEVQAVDGRALDDWADDTGDLAGVRREVGDVVRYEVRRPGTGLDLIQQVDVTLHRYPFAAAVRAAPHVVLLPVLLLAVGSLVFWSRPSTAPAWAFLVAAALLPATLTSTPLGLGVVDLAGARGTWPMIVGEAMAVLGLVALMLAVALLTRPEGRGRGVTAVLLAAPAVGYAVWVAALSDGADSALERQWVLATVWAPALWAAVPALLVIATLAHLRARGRSDVLATRLALLGVGAGVGAGLVLGPVPDLLSGAPLLSEDVLVLFGGGLVVACVAVAAARYRLGEIEPRVRRGLVQALVLVVVGAAFAGAVRAVDAAADISAGSMLAGGLLALLLLPAGVAVQRTVRRVVYGDREFPHRVVSDLRRLDALTAPEDALGEALELLARRLHLSYAAVEVLATPTSGPIAAAVGAPAGTPATVDLSVGGTTVGHLRVEVDAGHDPFGPGDRRLLEDVGTQVGALVQAVTANRELQVSRQRLVAAREEERRRLRRDLHDGLGPSLASLAMRLEAASDLIDDDPAQASNLVSRLSDQAREGIGEVRRLVEGLRPPALDQLGLVSALRHRAAEHGSAGAGVPWSVEADDDIEPLPAAVEVAAYRIVVEAVTNVQRHSGADRCVVRLARLDGDLRIDVSDTGSGLAPDRRPGVGLSSMRERAEELGGSFEAGDRPGGGTVVQVRLPLDQGPPA
jgi:two-component system, NarL family, sensor kinase